MKLCGILIYKLLRRNSENIDHFSKQICSLKYIMLFKLVFYFGSSKVKLVSDKKSEVTVLRREKGLNLYYMYVLYKSNNDKKYRYEVLSH